MADAAAEDVWDLVLHDLDLPRRRNWEALGRVDPPEEKPYLTELGAEGVHAAWAAAMRNLRLVHPGMAVPELSVLSEEAFAAHLAYLMVGIASETFPFDEREERFSLKPGVCVRGVTTDTLESYCREYLTCGAYCRRLERLCEAKPKRERRLMGYTKPGLIYLSFLDGVSKYLQGYRTTVLSLARAKPHLLQVSCGFTKLSQQMQFLGRLCKVHRPSEELPTGINLLCYLFDRTLHINTRDLYFVLVAILRRTAEPYFRFLERWIFQGIHHDDFSEFGLHSNPQCFALRARAYWTGAYTVADPSATSSFLLDNSVCGGGSFLADIQQQVYVCGKTVNLLRLCQPTHPLCAAMVLKRPGIKLLVSPVEQAVLKRECETFVWWMTKVAEEKTETLQQIEQKRAEERKKLLKIAHQKHKENLERLREEKRQRRERDDRRKKKVLDDLREQVEAAKQRKSAERQKKVEEDRKYAEMAKRKDEEEIRREEKVKQEMEEHYRRLNEEAEDRERRAVWKMKRIELRDARLKFWRGENKKVQEELSRLATLEEVKEVESKNMWKMVRVVEDTLKNVTLSVEDEEGNIVAEGVASVDDILTPGLKDRMLLQGFASLPGWAQTKLVESVKESQAEMSEAGDQVDVVSRRRSLSQSLSKRKRPDSFAESDVKRVEVEKGVMAPPPSSPSHWMRKSRSNLSLMSVESTETGVQVEESLAAALEKDHDALVRRRRPRELKTIEGRKRPVSKSIEEVLYPARFSQHGVGGSASEGETTPVTPSKTEFNLLPSLPVQPYTKEFDGLGGDIVESLASRLIIREGKKDRGDGDTKEVDSQAFAPLSLLMENSILIPLRAQLKVANAAMLNCLLVDSGLMDNFKAVRNYLLFYDGEFSHELSNSLFCEIRDAVSVQDVVSPSTLNRIVENAILSSTFGSKDPLSSNVGFVLRNPDDEDDSEGEGARTSSTALSLANVFDFLRLGFRVRWPCNVVLTDAAVADYGRIFAFLLQLRKAVWALEQVFVSLQELKGCENSPQFRRVHLMRHEMLNFITSTQNYVTSMVLDVSWSEFEAELSNSEKVYSVDTLYEAHQRYLKKALFRCILNRKAKPVHKIILDLFNIVAEFSLLLTRQPWRVEDRSEVTHPNMAKVEETYRHFKEYSKFLYTVVKKLAARGYQYHLYDLLLSLNFNQFYEKVDGATIV